MAIICYKPAGSCKNCGYYRWDNERDDFCCHAKHDVTANEDTSSATVCGGKPKV